MPRTGRPREFDRTVALERAMHTFWEHGYEATALSQLKEAMGGLSSASFYAAFGSKEALFDEALAAYLATHGQVMAPLTDATIPPREAIEAMLRGSARMQSTSGHPRGCMLVVSAATCAPANRHVQARLVAQRDRNRAALLARVSEAITSGALPRATDAVALASMFDTVLVGLSTQARDGVPRAALDGAVTQVMTVWDTLAARADRGVERGR